jgi:hypothetical protein
MTVNEEQLVRAIRSTVRLSPMVSESIEHALRFLVAEGYDEQDPHWTTVCDVLRAVASSLPPPSAPMPVDEQVERFMEWVVSE